MRKILILSLLFFTFVSYSQSTIQQTRPCKDDTGATIAGCHTISITGGRYAEVLIDTTYCSDEDRIVKYVAANTQHSFVEGDFVYADIVRGGCDVNNSTLESLWEKSEDTIKNTETKLYSDSIYIKTKPSCSIEEDTDYPVIDTYTLPFNELQSYNESVKIDSLNQLDNKGFFLVGLSNYAGIGLSFYNGCDCEADNINIKIEYHVISQQGLLFLGINEENIEPIDISSKNLGYNSTTLTYDLEVGLSEIPFYILWADKSLGKNPSNLNLLIDKISATYDNPSCGSGPIPVYMDAKGLLYGEQVSEESSGNSIYEVDGTVKAHRNVFFEEDASIIFDGAKNFDILADTITLEATGNCLSIRGQYLVGITSENDLSFSANTSTYFSTPAIRFYQFREDRDDSTLYPPTSFFYTNSFGDLCVAPISKMTPQNREVDGVYTLEADSDTVDLSVSIGNDWDVQIFRNKVIQIPGVDYNINPSNTINFTVIADSTEDEIIIFGR